MDWLLYFLAGIGALAVYWVIRTAIALWTGRWQ